MSIYEHYGNGSSEPRGGTTPGVYVCFHQGDEAPSFGSRFGCVNTLHVQSTADFWPMGVPRNGELSLLLSWTTPGREVAP